MSLPSSWLPCLALLLASGAQAVVFEKAGTYRNQVPSCSDFSLGLGAPVTAFTATDQAVALIFSVTGHRAGDIASVDYITPSGQVYAPASGPWEPMTAAEAGYQRFCFTDTSMKIAGTQAASLTGQWQIRVFYNNGVLTTLSFTISPGGTGGVPITSKLESAATFRDRPATCSEFLAGTKPVVRDFTATDAGVVLAFAMSGLQAGDLATSDWIGPSGQIAMSTRWDPIPSASQPGTYTCFYDSGFKIAGAAAAGMPGQWSVKVFMNGNLLTTVTFTIGGAASCTVTLGAASAQVGAGAGSGSVSVTAGSGCGWTATSSAPSWLSVTSGASGSGNGTVGFSYTANSSSSERRATISIADKTFTVVQAGAASAVCTYTISPASAQAAASAGSGSVTVTAGSGCGWTATSSAPSWLSVTSGASGSGNGTVSYSVAANASSSERRGTISIADRTFTLTQSGAAAACTVSISPASNQVAADAGSGSVSVTAPAGCSWTVTSSATSWLTVTSGSSGSGSGRVDYRYTANSTTAERRATIAIGDKTFTLIQVAPGGCTYSLSAASISVPASGKTGTIYVNTSANCSWTASTSATWVVITTATSSKGSGEVKYSIGANKAQLRTATLSVMDKSVTFTQAEAPAKPPAAAVVNAASRMPNTLPGGSIAPGSVFSIFSVGIGPETPVAAKGFPLETALGGTSVKVTVAGSTYEAWPVLTSNTQVDAVLPSTVGEGDATVVVTYNGKASAAFPFRVRRRSFGAFTSNHGSGPAKLQLISPGSDPVWSTLYAPARPGQEVVLWGTGLGPGDTPDSQSASTLDMSADLQVTVAGKAATVLAAGRSPDTPGNDLVRFALPADTPTGCYVPVQVSIGTVYANSVTMAVSADGGACSDPQNPFSNILTTGRKGGTIFLVRGNFVGVIDPAKGMQDVTLDMAIGLFLQSPGGGEQAFNPLLSLPPVGTCSAYTGVADSASSSSASQQQGVNQLGKALHAGRQLTIVPPKGQAQPLEGPDDEDPAGGYSAFLGGNVPSSEKKVLPLFFDPGRYRITGPGGRDVGAFDVPVDIPASIVWTNRDDMTTVDRNAPLTYRWSGGNPSQLVLLGATGTDQNTKATSGFYCFVPSDAGQYTVPQSILAGLPPTVDPDPKKNGAMVIFGSVPSGNFTTFSASGIDSGLVVYGIMGSRLTKIQ